MLWVVFDFSDSSNARTPTYRGFDSYYGYWSGFMDYYTKTYNDLLDLHTGLDLVTDETELSDDLHAAFLFQSKAEEIIADHATNYPTTPLYLYYAMQLMHFPLTAPTIYSERCVGVKSDYTDEEKYCGMSLMLDEAIANLTCTLKAYDMADDTILVVTSDNGGEGTISGDSVPFRGHKYAYFRGGLSANAFVSAGTRIPAEARGTFYDGQMHITGTCIYPRAPSYLPSRLTTTLFLCI